MAPSRGEEATIAREQPGLACHFREWQPPSSEALKKVDPTLLKYAQDLSTPHALMGANKRAAQLLQGYASLVRDYEAPKFGPFLPSLLRLCKSQWDLLQHIRPAGFALESVFEFIIDAIRAAAVQPPSVRGKDGAPTKLAVPVIKERACAYLETFVQERILFGTRAIAELAAEQIDMGDVILVYGRSSTVREACLYARRAGKEFSVLLVEDGEADVEPDPVQSCATPLHRVDATQPASSPESLFLPPPRVFRQTSGSSAESGAAALPTEQGGSAPDGEPKPGKDGEVQDLFVGPLEKEGIPVRSTPFLGICAQISCCSKVFLSGHVVLTNGALLDKSGTAIIALLAKNARKPIFVLCNTYKFSPKALLDSFCYNETGDPDAVCPDIPGANRLNLMFDVTPCEHLDLIITEHGIVPPTSIHGVIRNTKPRAQ